MIDAEDPVILAHMRLSGTALETGPASQVRFRSDVIADLDERDVRADLHNLTAHFMTDYPGRMDAAVSPRVPIINMGIRPAERGRCDTDDGIGRARFRIRSVGRSQSWLGRCLDERTHDFIVYQVVDSAYLSGKNGLRKGLRDR